MKKELAVIYHDGETNDLLSAADHFSSQYEGEASELLGAESIGGGTGKIVTAKILSDIGGWLTPELTIGRYYCG